MVNDPEPLLLELLDTICERFWAKSWLEDRVTMSCSRRHTDHDVDMEGFVILELVERTMDTTMQIRDDILDEFVLAVLARVARQTELMHCTGWN